MNEQPRNAFEALCDFGSLNNWCFNLFCTTCGHYEFRVGFSKLVHGEHPGNPNFWQNPEALNQDLELHGSTYNETPGLNNPNQYEDFMGRASVKSQIKLAEIVSEANLSEIKEICERNGAGGSWLGYLGLVIESCDNPKASDILSKSLAPQLINMSTPDVAQYLKNKLDDGRHLSVNDMSRICYGTVNPPNLPFPLISDAL